MMKDLLRVSPGKMLNTYLANIHFQPISAFLKGFSRNCRLSLLFRDRLFEIMRKTFTLFVTLFISVVGYTQVNGTAKGKVLDTLAKQNLTDATVSVLIQKIPRLSLLQ